jgi:hypothetical protein
MICYYFFNQLGKFKKMKVLRIAPQREITQILISKIDPKYYEKMYFSTCCKYPRLCNNASKRPDDQDNQQGLNGVCICPNGKLECVIHYKKSKQKKNCNKILEFLKDSIELDLKKLFIYTTERKNVFILYKTLITDDPSEPSWFHEKDMKPYTNFKELTGAKKKHYKKYKIDTGFIKKNYFSLPITRDKKHAKSNIIKMIESSKQIKTIYKKYTKHLIKDVVFDKQIKTSSMIGKYVIIEQSKKNESTKKKKIKKKNVSDITFEEMNEPLINNQNEDKKKKKKKNKNKQPSSHKRIFSLCDFCGELKVFDGIQYSSMMYKCKDCRLDEKQLTYTPKKIVVDFNKYDIFDVF